MIVTAPVTSVMRRIVNSAGRNNVNLGKVMWLSEQISEKSLEHSQGYSGLCCGLHRHLCTAHRHGCLFRI